MVRKIEQNQAPGFGESVGAMWRDMLRDLFGSYRPERHYMRGPGPKWRQKHAAA